VSTVTAIRTNAAAAMLGVSPNTLRSWERRFGFPMPRRTEGGHRQFDLQEIEALRQAFEETHNISSAVSVARQRGTGIASSSSLRAALDSYDERRCDRLLEESLAVRSVERTVESLLLPAVEALERSVPGHQGEHGFAWRYATGWLSAVQRVSPPASHSEGVVIFDSAGVGEMDALYAQALELFVRRAGLRALTLPLDLDPARAARALRAVEPSAIVLSGARASLDALGRLVYAARQCLGEVAVFDYRGAVPETGASTVARLGDGPGPAVDALRAGILGERPRHLRDVTRVTTA
jgi:MerR family transcriptional regulator, light-induced transcriptional regulator